MFWEKESKFEKYLGWAATFGAYCMYISYIPQLVNNLHGAKGNPIQPAVAAVGCTLWLWYGIKVKDWPVAAANCPGIIFGVVTALTAL